jgi:hypothetical protein
MTDSFGFQSPLWRSYTNPLNLRIGINQFRLEHQMSPLATARSTSFAIACFFGAADPLGDLHHAALQSHDAESVPGIASPGAAGYHFWASNCESAGAEDEWIGHAFWPSSRGWWTKSCWHGSNIWPPKIAS